MAKFSGYDFTLLYATVFGGSTNGKIGVAGDWGRGIAVDTAGNAYVTGRAESSDFPTTDGTGPNGYADAFVAKLSSDGSTLLYSTRLGGSGQNDGYGIALDGEGNAYVTGWTSSLDFPTTPGAFDTTYSAVSSSEAFVVKLSADGSQLLYSTLLGSSTDSGNGLTEGFAIAVDAAGNAHVTGWTGWFSTPDFPATPGAFDTSYNGGQDAFVAKLSADGSQLLYATYLGGNLRDVGLGIALDVAGNAYVTGVTGSSDFPTTPGAFETTPGVLGDDAFVVKLSADGSTLLYSTLLGGTGGDAAGGIAVDSEGNAYLIGSTCSGDFPTTAGALSRSQISRCGLETVTGDAFVAKLSADGSRLLYGTYLGGSAGDNGSGGIALDPEGNVYVAGRTWSDDFPTTDGSLEPGGGPWDAFVAKLSIVDTDVNLGTLGFDAIGYSVREDGGDAVITVIRRNGKDGEVSVDFATSDSFYTPATPGLDYVATSGTLVFADGETSKSFTVPILDDGETEGDERVVVTLSNVRGGATLGDKSLVWLTIADYEPPVFHTLTVTKTGSGGGTVTAGRGSAINCGSDCSASYQSGASVTLTPTPASGSTFAGWSGGGCAGTGSCQVVLMEDTTVEASFTLQQFTLTVRKNGGGRGTVVSSPAGIDCGSDCSYIYDPGAKVLLSATPDAGFTFTGWSGGTCIRTEPCQLWLFSDETITATFEAVNITPLSVGASSPPIGEVGVGYNAVLLAVSGGIPPYTATVISGSLPAGLNLGSLNISGTPQVAGNRKFTVKVSDQPGSSVSKKFTLNILKAVSISTTTLKVGTQGTSYKAALKAAGGKKPYSWSLVGGTLPTGLTLNGSTGAITGISTEIGTFSLTFQATDPLGGQAQKDLTLTIK